MSSLLIKPIGEFIEERTERLGKNSTTIYSVTNDKGFVRSLDLFDKQVFSINTGNYKRVEFKDIAYNPSRINVGSVALCEDKNGGAVSPMYCIVRCKSGLLPQYLLRFLKSDVGLNQIRHRCEGAVRFQLKFRDLSLIPIYIPSLIEQERIVKLLDEADELRKLRTQSDRRIAELIPALFCEMFGDPKENPEGWPCGVLTDFGAEVRYGLGQPPELDPEGVAILRATNVKRGVISEEGLIRVLREAVPASRNAFLNADDVLVVRSGAYTGDIARVGEKWAGSVAGYDLVISPKDQLTGDFIAWFLLSKFIQGEYFNALKLRAAQPHLNSTQVSEAPFFCPPLPLQKEFAKRIVEIREMELVQAASRKRLDDLFHSMLHRAFEGEL